MEEVNIRLIEKEKQLKSYERRFNLLKNNTTTQTSSKKTIIHLDNYYTDDFLLNFNYNRLNTDLTKKIEELLLKEIESNIYENKKISNLDDLIRLSINIFNRYSYLVKSLVEDKWLLYKYTDNQIKYELKEGEFVIDNSILSKYKDDNNLLFFLKRIYKILNNVAEQINYKVTTKFYDDEYHEICWLIFVFSKN